MGDFLLLFKLKFLTTIDLPQVHKLFTLKLLTKQKIYAIIIIVNKKGLDKNEKQNF